jgi:hypothetical protein
MMAAELEVFKFVEVKDKEQSEEEMEAVKQKIEEEIKRKTQVRYISFFNFYFLLISLSLLQVVGQNK